MHIGLFDSGVGGLTVLKELKKQKPMARFSYLGDTARLPYGNKAPKTLRHYSYENMEKLDQLGVDAVIVACHSASSVLLSENTTPRGTPLFNVISPSCQEAFSKSHNQRIGILATKATTRSQVYPSYLKALAPQAQVYSQECPLLVPLVEEQWIEDEITEMVLKRYLTPLLKKGVDTIILGCTHYPILKKEVQRLCGPDIQLIDPAQSIDLKLVQPKQEPITPSSIEVLLTDHSPHFLQHAQSLLGDAQLQIRHPE